MNHVVDKSTLHVCRYVRHKNTHTICLVSFTGYIVQSETHIRWGTSQLVLYVVLYPTQLQKSILQLFTPLQ